MTTAAEILIRIVGESAGLTKELDKSERGVKSFAKEVDKSGKQIGVFGNIAQGVFQGIGQAILNNLVGAVRAGIGEINKSIKAASDLNETVAKTQAVFRDSSADILAWSKTTSSAIGLTETGALSAASSLGNMFKQLGAGTGDAADFSKNLIGLAGDLTAFHNVAGGVPEVLEDIQSAFRGEYDPIQKYIPILNAAVVEQRALIDTGKESAKQLTALDKAMATQALIVAGMGDAYGAAAREIDSAASQQRIFEARIQESAATLGQILLPVQQAFYKGLNQLITTLAPYGENIMRSLASGLADGIIYILPVLAELRGVFVRLLKPGSPPKLLPELTEWGKGAMQAYLEGWGTADFDALRELGSTFESIIRSFAGTGSIKETDLVSRVFGTSRGLAQAIQEFRQVGSVSVDTLDNIRRAAGPAGEGIGNLVNAYFNLQRATKAQAEAQAGLDAVTRRYDATLSPLQKRLDDLGEAQSDLNDQERLGELGKIINDRRTSIDKRQEARLEQEQILLRDQIDAIEDERDAAVDAEQKKLDAAEQERAAKQQVYDQQQQLLDQQIKTNALIQEEIDLRTRLASEALAKEEEAAREREAAQHKAEAAERERMAGLEAITDAIFRMHLQTSDTAGQLALWTEKMHSAEKGSVDYYDAVTQVFLLTKKLNDELAAGGPPATDAANETAAAIGGLGEKWPEIVKVEEALEKFFATINGQDNVVSELTWGQGILDFITESGRLAEEAKPLVKGFIDLILGNDVEGQEPGADPFGDNWWLAGIIPGMKGILSYLETFRDGGWVAVWEKMRGDIFGLRDSIDPNADPRSFGFYGWLADTVIPAFDYLASEEWAATWDKFTETMRGGFQAAAQYVDDRIAELVTAINEFLALLKSVPEYLPDWMKPGNALPFNGEPGGGGGGGGGGDFSSYPGGGAPGLIPAVAGIAGMGGTTTTTSTTLGPINLVFNVPVTAEVAALAARTVDDELRARGLAPT